MSVKLTDLGNFSNLQLSVIDESISIAFKLNEHTALTSSILFYYKILNFNSC